MAEARLRCQWDMTAATVAKIHNVNCANPGDQITDPSSLNPFRRGSVPKTRLSLAAARALATGRKEKWGRIHQRGTESTEGK